MWRVVKIYMVMVMSFGAVALVLKLYAKMTNQFITTMSPLTHNMIESTIDTTSSNNDDDNQENLSRSSDLTTNTNNDDDDQVADDDDDDTNLDDNNYTNPNPFHIVPLSSTCLAHINERDTKHELFGTKFKSSCKFLPPPMKISSLCKSDDLTDMEKQIDSFPREAKNVQRYVMFLATGHSGHSLVGSLLDAHPMMLVANECDIFSRYLRSPLAQYPQTPLETRDEIFDDIFYNSLKCAMYTRYQHAYNYTVPHGWGGRWMPGKLSVIGDKKGGSTSHRLEELKMKSIDKMLITFKEFQKTIGLPIHIIHVYWKKEKRYQDNDSYIKILRGGISSSKFTASEWDNSVYTCGDDASRRSLFLDTCTFLGVPCDSSILDMWASMAKCKSANKHLTSKGKTKKAAPKF